MARYIDANKLMLHLNDYALTESPKDNESTEERRLSEMVYRIIQNCIKAVEEQPTAYDVEKVVAEIQKKHCQKCRNILGVAGAEEYCKEQKCEIDELCDIVKAGGVE